MRYSARQQHCLQAMGIVPWVSRYAAEETEDDVAEAALPGHVPDDAVPSQAPSSVASLGDWILSRALTPIHHRGSEFSVLGAEEASVLVIVESSGTGQATAVLEGDAARLFELMLHSIQLTARDTRQCLLSTEPLKMPEDSIASTGCTSATRAVLLLMNPWPFGVEEVDADKHHGRLQGNLPGLELPLWRIAHPRQLLESPLLKRQSWQVLKCLQAVLNGSAAA